MNSQVPALAFLFFFYPDADNAFSSSDSLSVKPKRVYTATRTDHPPRIDGKLDDACWKEGVWAGDFTQQQPYEGRKPTFPTEIKILYDYNNLYVAIRCYEYGSEKIRDIFTRRDEFGGDVTGIALDTYHDKETAFEFNLTAAGQKIDLKHKGHFEFDMNWNAVWDGATGREDSAWTAEMRIPFSQVRYTNKEEQVWGMHVWRWLDRKNEESQWQLIPFDSPAMVYLFGELNGIKNIRTSRQVELLPYALTKYIPDHGTQHNPYGFTKTAFAAAGLDAKIGLSSNFTLDATINPDFGQVEADPSVLNLTAFETFYEEKRPFFLEGNEIFEYNIGDDRLYYSRRIGQAPPFVPNIKDDHYTRSPDNSTILGAAKITGKTAKGMSVGILESVTAPETANIYFPNKQSDTAVAPLTNYFLARIKQDKNEANTSFGAIFSSTSKSLKDTRMEYLTPANAYTGGLDFMQQWKSKTYFIEGKGIFSYLNGNRQAIKNVQESAVHYYQRPDARNLKLDTTLTSLTGTGGYLKGGKKGGSWNYFLDLNWRSPGFDLNETGYLRQADYMAEELNVTYKDIDPGKHIRNYSIAMNQSLFYSFSGELVNSVIGLALDQSFNNLWGTYFEVNMMLPSFETRELRGGPALWMNPGTSGDFYFHSNYAKNFSVDGELYYLKKYNEPSKNGSIILGMNWIPFNKVKLRLATNYQNNLNEFQYIETEVLSTETRYLMGRLEQNTLNFTLRAEFYFKPEISLQFYGSPYYSVGHFKKFYRVDDAGARVTSDRFRLYAPNEIANDNITNKYSVNQAGSFTFDNPDFSFGQFRSNLVFRWEYQPGSVIYLVWSHENTLYENVMAPLLADNIRKLNNAAGKNVFLIKLNYWFSL